MTEVSWLSEQTFHDNKQDFIWKKVYKLKSELKAVQWVFMLAVNHRSEVG